MADTSAGLLGTEDERTQGKGANPPHVLAGVLDGVGESALPGRKRGLETSRCWWVGSRGDGADGRQQ